MLYRKRHLPFPSFILRSGSALPLRTSSKKTALSTSLHHECFLVHRRLYTKIYCCMMLKPSCSPYTFSEAKISLKLLIYMDMKAIPCTDSWKAVIFYKSTNFDFPLLVSLRQLHVFVAKVGNYKVNFLVENYASRFFQNPKNVSQDDVCYPVW